MGTGSSSQDLDGDFGKQFLDFCLTGRMKFYKIGMIKLNLRRDINFATSLRKIILNGDNFVEKKIRKIG